jgi:uncharacterized membrane protein
MQAAWISMVGECMASIKMTLPASGAEYEQMALRWTHLAAGTAWVGLLYFFNLVNVPFQKELDAPTKLRVVPLLMPRALWWFRWSAVVTVLVGFRYFMILAKTDAENTGVPRLLAHWLLLWFAVWTLAWLAAYLLLKFAKGPLKDGRVIAIPVTIVIAAASWGILQLLAHPAAGDRTLAISVGGGMGYFMLLNVWGVIWRCQKKLIAWTRSSAEHGTPMPAEAAALARLAFLASRTNFWLSFPMLFFMAASAHFPFLSGR